MHLMPPRHCEFAARPASSGGGDAADDAVSGERLCSARAGAPRGATPLQGRGPKRSGDAGPGRANGGSAAAPGGLPSPSADAPCIAPGLRPSQSVQRAGASSAADQGQGIAAPRPQRTPGSVRGAPPRQAPWPGSRPEPQPEPRHAPVQAGARPPRPVPAPPSAPPMSRHRGRAHSAARVRAARMRAGIPARRARPTMSQQAPIGMSQFSGPHVVG